MVAFTHVCWEARVNVVEVTSAELEFEWFVIHCIHFFCTSTVRIPWHRAYNSAVKATCSVLEGEVALEYP